MEKNIKILFISRAYPPVVGGIENQNFELSLWLPRFAEVKTIANKRGKKNLPLFIPYALLRALFLFKKYDVVLLGDGVLGIAGWVLKLFYAKPVISIIHGLDLTYKSNLYQKLWVNFFIKKLDKLIAVGNETIKAGVARGIPEEKFVFIANGVDTEKFLGNYSRKDLENVLEENLDGKKVILTLGRLAKRKGVAWFIENVMPQLPKNVIYVVSGEGPDKKNIIEAIQKNNLSGRIKLLGYVTDEEKIIFLNTCDLFIQPNIKVTGDMEGFGITVIEAGACRLPVVTSRLEGLQDAVKDGRNGFLLEPHDSKGYEKKISELLENDHYRKEFGKKAREFVIENYRWEIIARKYSEEIERVI